MSKLEDGSPQSQMQLDDKKHGQLIIFSIFSDAFSLFSILFIIAFINIILDSLEFFTLLMQFGLMYKL